MAREVLVLLYKKDKWHQHLDYLIDNHIFLQLTKNEGIKITCTDGLNIDNIKNKSFFGYKLIGIKKVNVSNKSSQFMKLHFFNCIALGKILLDMKGVYLSCESFFNKIKEL